MSAQEIGLVTALIGFVKELGAWPLIGTVLMVLIGPWVLTLMLARGNEKRFSAAVQMYKNNVVLLEETQTLAKNLKDLIVMNTEAMTKISDAINQNQFCPLQRVTKTTEVHGRKANE